VHARGLLQRIRYLAALASHVHMPAYAGATARGRRRGEAMNPVGKETRMWMKARRTAIVVAMAAAFPVLAFAPGVQADKPANKSANKLGNKLGDKLKQSAAKLGLNDELKPVGNVIFASLEQEPPPPGQTAKLLEAEIYQGFDSHECYAVAAVIESGAQLFVYAGGVNRRNGEIISEDADPAGLGKVVAVGFCLAKAANVRLLFLSNRPGQVAYRVFAKGNHMQAQQELDAVRLQLKCLTDCERRLNGSSRRTCKLSCDDID
jgi:hypothetical protein